jgi:hypothetical protein
MVSSELDLYHIQGSHPATTLYLQQSITYSTSNDWDLSVSSQNIPAMGGGAQNFQLDTYGMAAKTFRVDGVNVVAGGMVGYQLFTQTQYQPSGVGKSHQFYWLDSEWAIIPGLKLHGGAFWVNSALSTQTSYIGGMTGFKADYGDWRMTGDYYGGHTNVSGAQVNVGYFVRNWLNPYFGIIIPERNSGNEFAGVIGINIGTASLR